MSVNILALESSCDDTAAAVFTDRKLLSSVVANQDVHESYGGVVPELASRAHQQNIIPVVDIALKRANMGVKDIHAIAFTRGPGLLGSLLVGTSFAKSFALSLDIPVIDVHHLQAHILVHFIEKDDVRAPGFPFLCLLVSGGHTQLVVVKDHLDMEIVGKTIDDAAGEAFDKSAKLMGLTYPGGPLIDKLANEGDPDTFVFNKPKIKGLDYSFSGFKTSFLYFLRDRMKGNENFIQENKRDLAASLQKTLVDILMEKLIKASRKYRIKEIVLAGGVSANSGLRKAVLNAGKKNNWQVYIPPLSLTTDNAAMIGITAYYKYLKKEFCDQNVTPQARMKF
ncbi:MAG: tRNA (adenosine(37)-N6)-threonylcarbamoyltransferase complex transferase subunit TsaD [Bacteroidota bacterium]